MRVLPFVPSALAGKLVERMGDFSSSDRGERPTLDSVFDTGEVACTGSLPLSTRDLSSFRGASDDTADVKPLPKRSDGSPVPELRVPPRRAFAALLYRLWKEEKTGALEVRAEGVQTVIFFRGGTPFFAEHGTHSETLGKLAVRVGMISEEDFERASAHMFDGVDDDKPKRFGDVLVELGILTEARLQEALAVQVHRKVLSCFQWATIRAWFDEGTAAIAGRPNYPVQVPLLLAEGCSRYGQQEIVEGLLRDHASDFPILCEAPGVLESILGLDATEYALLFKMNGGANLKALEQDEAWDRVSSGALIVALHQLGVLELVAQGQAGEKAVSSTAEAPPSPAREQVSPPAMPVPQRIAKLEFGAEVACSRGLQLLERGEPEKAFEMFSHAVRLAGDRLEYRLYANYAAYLQANDRVELRETQRLKEETRRIAERALKQDESLARGHAILGHLARIDGDSDAAIAHFRRALDINPRDKTSQRELRILLDRQESDGGEAKPFAFKWKR
jgi:tetratricopeptide (TPR) repeat protein